MVERYLTVAVSGFDVEGKPIKMQVKHIHILANLLFCCNLLVYKCVETKFELIEWDAKVWLCV